MLGLRSNHTRSPSHEPISSFVLIGTLAVGVSACVASAADSDRPTAVPDSVRQPRPARPDARPERNGRSVASPRPTPTPTPGSSGAPSPTASPAPTPAPGSGTTIVRRLISCSAASRAASPRPARSPPNGRRRPSGDERLLAGPTTSGSDETVSSAIPDGSRCSASTSRTGSRPSISRPNSTRAAGPLRCTTASPRSSTR